MANSSELLVMSDMTRSLQVKNKDKSKLNVFKKDQASCRKVKDLSRSTKPLIKQKRGKEKEGAAKGGEKDKQRMMNTKEQDME